MAINPLSCRSLHLIAANLNGAGVRPFVPVKRKFSPVLVKTPRQAKTSIKNECANERGGLKSLRLQLLSQRGDRSRQHLAIFMNTGGGGIPASEQRSVRRQGQRNWSIDLIKNHAFAGNAIKVGRNGTVSIRTKVVSPQRIDRYEKKIPLRV